MKQFAYLFFILAFQVLLIGSCISGGIGNSLSKSSLTSYYVDLNLLNQPASLKNNVFNQSCWWKSGCYQHPLILIFCEISLKQFQTLKEPSVSDCRVFPLQYLWHALPLPLVLSSSHSKNQPSRLQPAHFTFFFFKMYTLLSLIYYLFLSLFTFVPSFSANFPHCNSHCLTIGQLSTGDIILTF